MNSLGAKVDPPETLSQPDSLALWPALGLSTAGGVLLGLAFPPDAWNTGWVALAPFILVVFGAADERSAFLRLLPGFLLAYAIAFPWPWRHPLVGPAIAGTLAWVWLALLPPAVLALAGRVERAMGPVPGIVAAAAGILTVEALVTQTPLAMPWALMGHTQADSSWTWGLAATSGVEALSTAVTATSCFLAYALRHRRWVVGSAGIGAVMAVLLLAPVPKNHGSSGLSVGIVQPGLGPLEWNQADSLRISRLRTLSAELDGEPDLILWPESAVRKSSEMTSATVISGLTSLEPATNGISTQGGLVYEKRRLVPFVEAVPGEVSLPALGKLRLDPDGYRPGTLPPTITFGGNRIGLAICFETLFGAHFQALTRTRVNVAVTQDGWWRSPVPAYQHLAFSRFRALESGVPLAIASVNGYSAMIGTDGRFVWLSAWNEPTTAIVNVPRTRPSTYSGNLIAVPAVVVFLMLLLLSSPTRDR